MGRRRRGKLGRRIPRRNLSMSFIQMTCISSYFLKHARTYIYCLYLKCMNQISIVSKSLKSRNQNGLQGCQTNVLTLKVCWFPTLSAKLNELHNVDTVRYASLDTDQRETRLQSLPSPTGRRIHSVDEAPSCKFVPSISCKRLVGHVFLL